MEIDEQAEMAAMVEYGKHNNGVAVNTYAFTKALEVYEAHRNKHSAPNLGTNVPNQNRDINTCPGCGGPADNGFDRCLPPSPYLCTKCDNATKTPLTE